MTPVANSCEAVGGVVVADTDAAAPEVGNQIVAGSAVDVAGGKVTGPGDVSDQAKRGSGDYHRHDGEAVETVGEVDGIARADDHESADDDIEVAELDRRFLEEGRRDRDRAEHATESQRSGVAHEDPPTHVAVGDIDGNNKDDAIIDFGSGSGIWIRYNNTSWTQLHTATSQILATGDLDGSGKEDVLIDFGASGLYVRYNNATWLKLHTTSPVNIATADLDNDGKDDAVIDFGGSLDLYVRYNNTTLDAQDTGDPGDCRRWF